MYKERKLVLYIGIDIAKADRIVGTINEAGVTTLELLKATNTSKGFSNILKHFEKVSITADNCPIGLEATGHYWLSIFEFLADHDFNVSIIDAIQTDTFRNVLSIRKNKTATIDCILIADLLRFNSFEPSSITDESV